MTFLLPSLPVAQFVCFHFPDSALWVHFPDCKFFSCFQRYCLTVFNFDVNLFWGVCIQHVKRGVHSKIQEGCAVKISRGVCIQNFKRGVHSKFQNIKRGVHSKYEEGCAFTISKCQEGCAT